MNSRKFRTLDVRPVLQRGGEPFSAIMSEVSSLKPNEGLILLSPFLPSPLVAHLKGLGFEARSENLPDGSWQTVFTRP